MPHKDRACKDVIVAAEVLGGGMDDDVSAVLNGALVDWRGKSGVDADQCAARMAQCGYAPHIHTAQVRVGGRLGEEERDMLLLQHALQGGHVCRVDH